MTSGFEQGGRHLRTAFVALSLAWCAAAAGGGPRFVRAQSGAPAVADAARGELLYDAACRTCHSTQPHWRDRRIARSWPELVAQVDRWRRVAAPSWGTAEIGDVAGFLNERFYRFVCDGPGCQAPRSDTQGR